MYKTLGVLLAGGESRRFGRQKALAEYKGKLFWEYSYQVLQKTTDQQLIISHPNLNNVFQQKSGISVMMDDVDVKGKGPLAGIYTAMKHNKAEWYVFLSCDIPLITPEVVQELLKYRNDQIKVIIPKIDGRLHPLIGVYHHSIFLTVRNQLLKNELKIMSLLEQFAVHYVTEQHLQVDIKKFSNINSPKDYDEFLKNDKISESD